MKPINLKFTLVILCLFFAQSAWSQDEDFIYKKTDKNVQSFTKFFKDFDWTNFEEEEPVASFSCKGDGMPKISRTRNPLRNARPVEYTKAILRLKEFMRFIESYVEGDKFDKVKEEKGSFFDTPTFKRDKMIEKLQTSNNAAEFIRFYSTKLDQSKVKFSKEEKEKLTKVYNVHYEYFWKSNIDIVEDHYSIGDCNYITRLFAWPTLIQANKVVWNYELSGMIYCNCLPESSTFKLRRVNFVINVEVESEWRNYNYETMIFKSYKKPKLKIWNWACCGSPDPWSDDGNGYERTKPGYVDPKETEKNDEQEDKLKEKDKDCCYEEQASNSIGLFPILSFGNNLEDSTIGLSAEYLHNMGNSFGNNQWFAGLQATFATSSGQGGELTENFYSGAAIIENRTPILPCVQWVQRVVGEYGKGTLEAFGNTDDFTHFTVGVNTGFNFDLTSNFSITADANIFEIGSQTFTPASGPEIITDIANLNLPPTNVRFGFRFKF